MANRVTMSICGEEYTLVAEESSAYMEKVGALVDKKMSELMDTAHMGRGDAAVLAAAVTAACLMSRPYAAATAALRFQRHPAGNRQPGDEFPCSSVHIPFHLLIPEVFVDSGA